MAKKQDAKELVNNSKIFIGNNKVARLVQDKLHRIGYDWSCGEQYILDIEYIFCIDGKLYFFKSLEEYLKSNYKDISINELLNLRILKEN